MCDYESIQAPSGGALGIPEQGYNRVQDIDPRIRQHKTSASLAHGPNLRMQLEQRLVQSQRDSDKVAEALKLLTPDVEKMIEAFRVLNRLGMLQL